MAVGAIFFKRIFFKLILLEERKKPVKICTAGQGAFSY